MTVFTLVVSSGAKWVLALTLWKPDFQVHLLRLPIRDPPPFQSTHTHTNCTVLCTTINSEHLESEKKNIMKLLFYFAALSQGKTRLKVKLGLEMSKDPS